jgi:hypothetical protein
MRQTNRERRGEREEHSTQGGEWVKTQDINRGMAMTNTDETRSAEKTKATKRRRKKKEEDVEESKMKRKKKTKKKQKRNTEMRRQTAIHGAAKLHLQSPVIANTDTLGRAVTESMVAAAVVAAVR